MGLKLRDDILRPMQESGGNLILPPSLVTLRDVNRNPGQQFRNASNLLVAGDFAAKPVNTIHYVYLVAPGGVPQIVLSINVNSTGPAGFTAWELVGAFYTNGAGTVGFGSFTSIHDKPTTNPFDAGPMGIKVAGGGAWNKNNIVQDITSVERDGGFAKYRISYQQGASTQAVGNNVWLPPINLDLDPTRWTVAGAIHINAISTGHVSTGSVGKSGNFAVNVSESGFFFIFDQVSGANNQSSFASQSNAVAFLVGGIIIYPVTGWSNVPLKDL